MPRYLFHFVSNDCSVPDGEGVILSDVTAAHRHATRLINRTVPFMVGQNLRHWHIDVVDNTDRVVLTVLFPVAPPLRDELGRRVSGRVKDTIRLR